MVRVRKTFKGHLVQPPCDEQGYLPLDQVAQSPSQPDLEDFQGWGIYHLSGLPSAVFHHTYYEKFLPYTVIVWLRPVKKRHTVAPPTAGVWRRMERNRQKLVGRDKGSLTEQQTKGTVATTIQIRRIHKTKQ